MRRSFCPLPDEIRGIFEALKTSVAYDKGEVVFHESDLCHSVYFVCDGTTKLVTVSSEGKTLLLRFAGAGEILGASEAAQQDARYAYSAIAMGPLVLAVISRDTFMRFVASHAETCFRLTVVLAEQYKLAQRETRFLAFGENSTARLARLLLDWSAERGKAFADGVHIPSRVTHTELAQAIGSTRETVTRILSVLNHSGIVERTSDEIVIHGGAELTRLGSY